MSTFEDSLKRSLRRKQPSPDFTARVLAAVARDQDRPANAWLLRSKALWLAPLAATLLLSSGLGYERYHQRQEGLEAKEKLVFALRLTGEKLHEARARVVGISEGRGAQ